MKPLEDLKSWTDWIESPQSTLLNNMRNGFLDVLQAIAWTVVIVYFLFEILIIGTHLNCI